MLRVLLAAAEAAPFAKRGGLADVLGALPRELRRQGVDARVVLPLYGHIPPETRRDMAFVGSWDVPVGWRRQYCGLFSLTYREVPFYFLDNEYYFKRPGLYGYDDDAERFAYFSRAVLTAVPRLDFSPQIIHAHDWHTAPLCALLAAHYRRQPPYAGMRTVFTIHNLAYQGVVPLGAAQDLLDLPGEYFTAEGLEFFGQANFLKAGLVYADKITTVSATYAEEIQTPQYGEHLETVLQRRRGDLVGIVNGLDDAVYDPATDPLLFTTYTSRALAGKKRNKLRLQKMLGLPVRPDVPLLAMVSRLVAGKGLDLVAAVLPALLARDIQLVVLGTGEQRYEDMFRRAAATQPEKLAARLLFDETVAHRIYGGADYLLMPSLFEPCGISQLIAMRYGTLPIVRETGGLRDTVRPYNEYTGEGTGFSFSPYDAGAMLHVVDYALGFYHDAKVLRRLRQNAMAADWGWSGPARAYREIYAALAPQPEEGENHDGVCG